MALTAEPAGARRRGRAEGPWTVWGFFGPVDIGALNVASAGATVPLHFRVFAGDVELTDPAVVHCFSVRRLAGTPGPDTETVEVPTTSGATVLRYARDRLEQSWRTPASPGRYLVTVTAVDGGSLSAHFLLR